MRNKAQSDFWGNVKFSMFHRGIQSNLEGESNSLAEVTEGFFPGNPSFQPFLILGYDPTGCYKILQDPM